ncbi:hypothetical protein [Nonomuraea sp. NPDC002799]
MTAAIGAYGTSVLAKTNELAAETAVARGTRILQRVFGRGDTYSSKVVERLAGSDDEAAREALRLAIVEAFQADPILAGEVAAMLPRVAVAASGDRSVRDRPAP